jgi:hypothetical protein
MLLQDLLFVNLVMLLVLNFFSYMRHDMVDVNFEPSTLLTWQKSKYHCETIVLLMIR